MALVGIIDNGLSNLDSVVRAMRLTKADLRIIRTSSDLLLECDKVLLPGVGAIADAMAFLRQTKLDAQIIHFSNVMKKPTLGICLGMQLIGKSSEESGGCQGLSLIPGKLTKIKAQTNERVPHVGWNNVDFDHNSSPLLEGISSGKDFYFVHSFAYTDTSATWALGTTDYCGGFASVIASGNTFGCQFHPEKSQGSGQRILQNFVDNC